MGGSTVFLAKACLRKGISDIYAIDLFSGTPSWNQTFDTYEATRKRMTAYQLDRHVTLIRSNSLDYAWDRKIDVFHLDADHEYQAVANDIDKYIPFLADEGIAVFDDYDAAHPGVKKAMHELLLKRPQFEVVAVNFEGWIRQYLPAESREGLAGLTGSAHKLTILSVFGTRPEAIKMAPVIKELGRYPDRVRSVICSSGQHREMLDQVLDLFQITPDYELNLMRPDQSLSQLTASLFTATDSVVREVNPDWILAQGDTTTVFVAAMVAFYNKIGFGHVEAGLRTGDRQRPFPEEINRRFADILSDLYFAPTETARQAC